MDNLNQFITWSMLANYSMFVSIVFVLVQVIKELPKIKDVPTRLISIAIAFVLQILVNLQSGNFQMFDIVLYLISAIIISLTANGAHDATIKIKTE
ncbi:hypothetical protein [Desulfosporosinus sp.]|uniref:hypothetical protein n=1 Tax=Desulfosporosinus sp. TaxID=157907 RepID=UPI00260DA92A|nr:hypothetical protein [Desulfosporosinus sp.]